MDDRSPIIDALKNRSSIEYHRGKYWLDPAIRTEAISRLRNSANWIFANRSAAKFWTNSVIKITSLNAAITALEAENYGRYVGEPTSLQLARYFHLDDRDLHLVHQKRGNHNRLGFAIQLGTVSFSGTFLTNPIDVPSGVISYLANQLEITDIDCLTNYLKRIRTHWEHIEEIKHNYGYRDFISQPEHWRLIRWLYGRAWVSAESPSVLFDVTTSQLVENKILLPGVTLETTVLDDRLDLLELLLKDLLSKSKREGKKERLRTLKDLDTAALKLSSAELCG